MGPPKLLCPCSDWMEYESAAATGEHNRGVQKWRMMVTSRGTYIICSRTRAITVRLARIGTSKAWKSPFFCSLMIRFRWQEDFNTEIKFFFSKHLPQRASLITSRTPDKVTTPYRYTCYTLTSSLALPHPQVSALSAPSPPPSPPAPSHSRCHPQPKKGHHRRRHRTPWTCSPPGSSRPYPCP